MSDVPYGHPLPTVDWHLPSKRRVGMFALIAGESAVFTIFVVAYVFYVGKSLTGPTPVQVLEVPILGTICLLSSSFTIWRAEQAVENDQMASFTAWLGATIALAAIFLRNTAVEWRKLNLLGGAGVAHWTNPTTADIAAFHWNGLIIATLIHGAICTLIRVN